MAKTVSTEEQIANSAATNQQQKQQPPQKPKDQHKSVAEESQQPQVQQPTAPTSIKFYSLKLFLKNIFIICLSYNIDFFFACVCCLCFANGW